MDKDFLKGISKEAKKDFLTKLQSGEYELLPVYDLPKRELNFDLVPGSGLYFCKETGELMNREEIKSLRGYGLGISVVSDRQQVTGEKPPKKIILYPVWEYEYLNSLLIEKPSHC